MPYIRSLLIRRCPTGANASSAVTALSGSPPLGGWDAQRPWTVRCFASWDICPCMIPFGLIRRCPSTGYTSIYPLGRSGEAVPPRDTASHMRWAGSPITGWQRKRGLGLSPLRSVQLLNHARVSRGGTLRYILDRQVWEPFQHLLRGRSPASRATASHLTFAPRRHS